MKVLISGGGIGGFALARLLRDAGHDCLVIERAREFRPLGHFIASWRSAASLPTR